MCMQFLDESVGILMHNSFIMEIGLQFLDEKVNKHWRLGGDHPPTVPTLLTTCSRLVIYITSFYYIHLKGALQTFSEQLHKPDLNNLNFSYNTTIPRVRHFSEFLNLRSYQGLGVLSSKLVHSSQLCSKENFGLQYYE